MSRRDIKALLDFRRSELRALTSLQGALVGRLCSVTYLVAPVAMLRRSLLALAGILLVGCASSPNSFWFESGFMRFEVLVVGPNQHKLTAYGAGAHDRAQVERGFLLRSEQLCAGRPFQHAFQTEPYEYTSSGGMFASLHRAFKTIGVVTCG